MTIKEFKENYYIQDTGYKSLTLKKMTIEPYLKSYKILFEFQEGDTIDYVSSSLISLLNQAGMIAIIFKYKIENDLIFLEPSTYWTIYKKLGGGKDFLSRQINLNGKKMKFAGPSDYFDTKDFVVYGIYNNDELLYIGSSSNWKQRFTQHCEGFEGRYIKMNKMYKEGTADTIHFEILCDQTQASEILEMPVNNMYLMEMIEKYYIENLRPKYNKEGIVYRFHFQASMPMSIRGKVYEKLEQRIKDSPLTPEEIKKEDSD